MNEDGKLKGQPKCGDYECFANACGVCLSLTSNDFNGDCPFFKSRDEASMRQIEEEIKDYYA